MTGDYPAHGTCNGCQMEAREAWPKGETAMRCMSRDAGWKYGAVIGFLLGGYEDYPVYTPAWCPRQSGNVPFRFPGKQESYISTSPLFLSQTQVELASGEYEEAETVLTRGNRYE